MRSRRRSTLPVAIVVAVLLATIPQRAQIAANAGGLEISQPELPADFIFHKRVDEVNLLFTVVDKGGNFISNLQLEDFSLLDDRRPPEKIHAFHQESDLPLRVALVVDLSGSVTYQFKNEQQAAVMFFKKILRPAMDQAAVIGFNEKVSLLQDFTNDVNALKAAVYGLKPDGETALFDAIVFAGEQLRRNSTDGTRRAIILISDGDNNHSRSIMNDAQHAAIRADAPIYSLSTNLVLHKEYPPGQATLELLSRYTGGELLSARERGEVTRAFRKVEKALRSQYVLSYKPADFVQDGRYRQVALSAKKSKLRVECRHGYFAPTP